MIEIERGKTSQVGREIRLRLSQTAEPHEFVGAEFIGLEDLRALLMQTDRVVISLPEIRAPRPLRCGTDTIFPIVTIGEAASGPANNGDMNLVHHVNQLRTDTISVGNLRLLSHPHAVVNDSTDVLCELAVDVR
jgi:hypothetical protein